MEQDRIKWNERYRNNPVPRGASEIVKRFQEMIPGGFGLDIACGTGRNSRFLARKDFDMDAVDVADVAINALAGIHPKIRPMCVDLDTWTIPADTYDLILNIRFLNRRLFPYIKEGLKPGGLLIFESYLESEDGMHPPVSCRDYLLRENELLHAFLSLKIIYYEERDEDSRYGMLRVASLVGMKI